MRSLDGAESPSERYARSRRTSRSPVFHDFAQLYDFELDGFQVEACRQLEAGHGVLVAAPTGSGKTLVGEFAVHLALQQGRKCFYTAPIKALSNQKYADLVDRYGADSVGLLTGDNTINGEAPIVVMTTEVLRNMLYAGSSTLTGLGYVVMDEVHYLADRFRGAVWEEVIIHLPESVALVSLSATVSNAEEFGEWLETVRGETATIVEERRPVPLYQHVLVGRRMYDLFADGTSGPHAGPGRTESVNPELMRIARDDWRRGRTSDRRAPRGRNASRGRGGQGQRQGGPRLPSRFEVVDRLDSAGLLPAIVFVFSRVGCDAAVTQCLNANLRLTTPEERAEIIELVESRCRHLPDEDLHVLGYHDFLEGLSRGVAAHHAGMLPTFKECVEQLFTSGRCKVVFATETLALGINMPARSVVIEKLSKWNGETHADITPGEYTQLTGRAGRRGIDVEGHGVVLWQQGFDPTSVAGLASTRTYPLKSSFRPSYNMAVNLVHQVGRATARELLESSFAQFQADKAVVGLARQLRKAEEALEGYAEAATLPPRRLHGVLAAAAPARGGGADPGPQPPRRPARRRARVAGGAAARRRDPGARREVLRDGGGARPRDALGPGRAPAVRPHRRPARPAAVDGRLPGAGGGVHPDADPEVLQRPQPAGAPRPGLHPAGSHAGLHAATGTGPARRRPGTRGRPGAAGGAGDQPAARPSCARIPATAAPTARTTPGGPSGTTSWSATPAPCTRRIEQRTNTIARQFDRVCEVLTSLGYLEDDEVTPTGARLMRIYTDMDLVAAEALRRGLWDGLSPGELAAALSALVFEARRPDDAVAPRLPGGRVKQVLADTVTLWADLDALEREHKLDFLREPDLGFAWAAYRWAEGAALDEVLGETDLAAGDFVRWVKQLLDLTDQVADAAGSGELRTTARAASDALRRGVVSYSSVAD